MRTEKKKLMNGGYNYLMNIRKRTLQGKVNNLPNNDLVDKEKHDNTNNLVDEQSNYIIKFLQDEIVELKKQLVNEQERTKHWQELYIKQNEDFKNLAFPIMLDNKEKEVGEPSQVSTKKSWWNRLFD